MKLLIFSLLLIAVAARVIPEEPKKHPKCPEIRKNSAALLHENKGDTTAKNCSVCAKLACTSDADCPDNKICCELPCGFRCITGVSESGTKGCSGVKKGTLHRNGDSESKVRYERDINEDDQTNSSPEDDQQTQEHHGNEQSSEENEQSSEEEKQGSEEDEDKSRQKRDVSDWQNHGNKRENIAEQKRQGQHGKKGCKTAEEGNQGERNERKSGERAGQKQGRKTSEDEEQSQEKGAKGCKKSKEKRMANRGQRGHDTAEEKQQKHGKDGPIIAAENNQQEHADNIVREKRHDRSGNLGAHPTHTQGQEEGNYPGNHNGGVAKNKRHNPLGYHLGRKNIREDDKPTSEEHENVAEKRSEHMGTHKMQPNCNCTCKHEDTKDWTNGPKCQRCQCNTTLQHRRNSTWEHMNNKTWERRHENIGLYREKGECGHGENCTRKDCKSERHLHKERLERQNEEAKEIQENEESHTDRERRHVEEKKIKLHSSKREKKRRTKVSEKTD